MSGYDFPNRVKTDDNPDMQGDLITIQRTEIDGLRDRLKKLEEEVERLRSRRGVWVCDNCSHVDFVEREVRCWMCGKGEMAYVEISNLSKKELANMTRMAAALLREQH